jgi:type II secretory pathway component PulJ
MKRHSPRPRKRRGGWQLVELSMVLALFAIVGAAATRVIVGLMAIENRSGQALQDAEILNHLGRQWREDLHRATSSTVRGDGKSVQLRLEGEANVTYQVVGEKLTRQKTGPGQRTPARETFAASARGWRFEQVNDGRIISVLREHVLVGLMRTPNPTGPVMVDRIEGVIGTLTEPAEAAQAAGGPR